MVLLQNVQNLVYLSSLVDSMVDMVTHTTKELDSLEFKTYFGFYMILNSKY